MRLNGGTRRRGWLSSRQRHLRPLAEGQWSQPALRGSLLFWVRGEGDRSEGQKLEEGWGISREEAVERVGWSLWARLGSAYSGAKAGPCSYASWSSEPWFIHR